MNKEYFVAAMLREQRRVKIAKARKFESEINNYDYRIRSYEIKRKNIR